MSKKLYPYFLVLVGPGNGLEHDFTIELKKLIIEDWLKRLISSLIEYRQNQTKTKHEFTIKVK